MHTVTRLPAGEFEPRVTDWRSGWSAGPVRVRVPG